MAEKSQVSREVLGIVESVDRSLRLRVHRGLNVLYQHDELQDRNDASQYYIGKALQHAERALAYLRDAKLELGIEEEEKGET